MTEDERQTQEMHQIRGKLAGIEQATVRTAEQAELAHLALKSIARSLERLVARIEQAQAADGTTAHQNRESKVVG